MIDMVPKAITLTLVNHSKEDLQRELLQELYKPDVLEDLLKESELVVARRKEVVGMVSALNKAEECVLFPYLPRRVWIGDTSFALFTGLWRVSEGALSIPFVVNTFVLLSTYFYITPLSNCECTNNTRAGPGQFSFHPPFVFKGLRLRWMALSCALFLFPP